MKTVEVVAGIIEVDGKILCAQRAEGKYEYVSLKWEFPGGKIEEGETHIEALERELKEELDIDVEVKKHYIDITHQYPDFMLKMYCYLCSSDICGLKLNVHKNLLLLDKKDLHTLDWAPADAPIIDKLVSD